MSMTAAARDRVGRLLRLQRGQIDRLGEADRRRLLRILTRARRDLREQLEAAAISPLFGVANLRASLAQVSLAVASLERDMLAGLGEASQRAYELARRHFEQQVETFALTTGHDPPPLDFRTSLALDDDLLLLQHQASVRTYGTQLIRRVQDRMVTLAAQGVPWTEMVRQVAGIDGILAEDITGGPDARKSGIQSRAERIVRTELSRAYNAGHQANAVAAQAADPEGGWRKQLVATFDNRTGEDSKFVHGQVREVDKPFKDNKGREYMHPPGRPNDREVQVVTRLEYLAEGLGGTSAEEAQQAAERDTNRERASK